MASMKKKANGILLASARASSLYGIHDFAMEDVRQGEVLLAINQNCAAAGLHYDGAGMASFHVFSGLEVHARRHLGIEEGV